jgi:hypothetical protein
MNMAGSMQSRRRAAYIMYIHTYMEYRRLCPLRLQWPRAQLGQARRSPQRRRRTTSQGYVTSVHSNLLLRCLEMTTRLFHTCLQVYAHTKHPTRFNNKTADNGEASRL